MEILRNTDPKVEAAHNHAVRKYLLEFTRNGRCGDCVDCPRDSEQNIYPEFCANTTRNDHQLTIEDIAGYTVTETLGQVFGVVVRSRGLGGNIIAGLRSIVGGEIKEYTEMLEDARKHAMDRMVKNASAMGANAVVRMLFDSSELGQSMSEIVAYGTAVKIKKR